MSTVLLITVGGSPQPIVTAIQALEPDRVIFISSGGARGSVSQIIGEGTPCEVRRGGEIVERLPNIPTQLGLGDRFNPSTDLILLDNPDDLAECYRVIAQKIRDVQQEAASHQLYADYTGGTKTMSLALGMAALDHGVSLFLTTSATRENLFRVERGESTERAPTTLVTVERTINQFVPTFLAQYNYPAAIAQLQTLLKSLELPVEQRRQIRELRDLCAGLDAWDRFDHAEAWLLLETQMKRIQSLGLFLKRVMASRMAIDPSFQATGGIPGHGYEIVEDLLLNAERRVSQQRYDDAMGRLYRALELLVQIRLKQTYGLETGDLDVSKLPEVLRETYEKQRSPRNNKVQIALWTSYELLSQLTDDPLGELFQEQARYLLTALEVRNHSLFAHGFQPITAGEYANAGQVMIDFIQAGLEKVTPTQRKMVAPQFPTDLKL